jgi:hypothetical protein
MRRPNLLGLVMSMSDDNDQVNHNVLKEMLLGWFDYAEDALLPRMRGDITNGLRTVLGTILILWAFPMVMFIAGTRPNPLALMFLSFLTFFIGSVWLLTGGPKLIVLYLRTKRHVAHAKALVTAGEIQEAHDYIDREVLS